MIGRAVGRMHTAISKKIVLQNHKTVNFKRTRDDG